MRVYVQKNDNRRRNECPTDRNRYATDRTVQVRRKTRNEKREKVHGIRIRIQDLILRARERKYGGRKESPRKARC